MKISIPKRFALLAVCLIAIGAVFVLCNPDVDFTDNPALLVEISDSGRVTLETHQGTLVASLANVNWVTNSEFLIQARGLVGQAQRDKVAFVRLKDGKIRIWYETESGTKSLNQKLQDLSKRLSK